MSNIVIILLFTLIVICIALTIKLYFMKKSVKEIEAGLKDILKSDTNNLITISSSEKNIKKLATSLNVELKTIRKQKLQYESGNQELKKLVTNISHDLRTPLTAIKGYIDLIEKDKLSKDQEKYLNIIQKKTDELTELTEQLFDFSKTIDSDIKISKEKCNINEILEEVLASYYVIFKEKGIEPQISMCSENVYKKLNKASIIRIFENILSNISKYCVNNFKVELKDDGTIIFANKVKDGLLDATTVQKIFDRYFTVENAKKSTGIGLSIAKELVELNDGSISANFTKDTLIIEIKFLEKFSENLYLNGKK